MVGIWKYIYGLCIGGPTLELLAESYNQIHETDIDMRVVDNGSGYGYQLKWSNEEFDSSTGNGDYIQIDYSTIDDESLYIINNNERAFCYLIASPIASNTYSAMCGYCYQILDDAGISSNDVEESDFAVRPVVVLKSNVQLEKQADSSFEIIN